MKEILLQADAMLATVAVSGDVQFVIADARRAIRSVAKMLEEQEVEGKTEPTSGGEAKA